MSFDYRSITKDNLYFLYIGLFVFLLASNVVILKDYRAAKLQQYVAVTIFTGTAFMCITFLKRFNVYTIRKELNALLIFAAYISHLVYTLSIVQKNQVVKRLRSLKFLFALNNFLILCLSALDVSIYTVEFTADAANIVSNEPSSIVGQGQTDKVTNAKVEQNQPIDIKAETAKDVNKDKIEEASKTRKEFSEFLRPIKVDDSESDKSSPKNVPSDVPPLSDNKSSPTAQTADVNSPSIKEPKQKTYIEAARQALTPETKEPQGTVTVNPNRVVRTPTPEEAITPKTPNSQSGKLEPQEPQGTVTENPKRVVRAPPPKEAITPKTPNSQSGNTPQQSTYKAQTASETPNNPKPPANSTPEVASTKTDAQLQGQTETTIKVDVPTDSSDIANLAQRYYKNYTTYAEIVKEQLETLHQRSNSILKWVLGDNHESKFKDALDALDSHEFHPQPIGDLMTKELFPSNVKYVPKDQIEKDQKVINKSKEKISEIIKDYNQRGISSYNEQGKRVMDRLEEVSNLLSTFIKPVGIYPQQ